MKKKKRGVHVGWETLSCVQRCPVQGADTVREKALPPAGPVSLLRGRAQSLLTSSWGKSSRQYTSSQRNRMKYIMSGCWTNCVRESLCGLWLSRSEASPEWLAFLQEGDTAVTSGTRGERTPPPNRRAAGSPGRPPQCTCRPKEGARGQASTARRGRGCEPIAQLGRLRPTG